MRVVITVGNNQSERVIRLAAMIRKNCYCDHGISTRRQRYLATMSIRPKLYRDMLRASQSMRLPKPAQKKRDLLLKRWS